MRSELGEGLRCSREMRGVHARFQRVWEPPQMLPVPSTCAGNGERRGPHLGHERCSTALSTSDARSHIQSAELSPAQQENTGHVTKIFFRFFSP